MVDRNSLDMACNDSSRLGHAGLGAFAEGGAAAPRLPELASDESPALEELLRLERRVSAGELEANTALQRVVVFLEKAPRHPVAMEIYRSLSLLQYQAGRSCPSFSHPPPPPRSR